MSEKSKLPAPPAGFISEGEILNRIPVCRRTWGNWKKKGIVPYIAVGRRVLYDWESVRAALLRAQKNTE